MIETILRRWVACLALLSAMSMASPPPDPKATLVIDAGADSTSRCASAVRATEGKWWLPMSKYCMPSMSAAMISGLRWPRL